MDKLLAMFAGTFVGYFIGAMPGLTPSIGIALMVPFTFGLDPVVSMVMLVSLYMSAEYGGGITAILLNAPGTAAAAATAFDGYPMAKKGQAGKALTISILASGFGALISSILLIITAVPLANLPSHSGHCVSGQLQRSEKSLEVSRDVRDRKPRGNYWIGSREQLCGEMKVTDIPKSLLATCVTVICVIGAYASSNDLYPVWVMIITGILGYMMRKVHIPMAPIVLALVLGFMMEVNFRRAYIQSGGDMSMFLKHPITLILIILALVTVIWPVIREMKTKKAAGTEV